MASAFVLLWLVVTLCTCDGARILAIMPVLTRSHAHLMNPLVLTLAARGHTITFMTVQPMDNPGPNITQIDLPTLREETAALRDSGRVFEYRWLMPVAQGLMMPFYSPMFTRLALKEEQVRQLIQSDQHFDLILGEVLADEALLAGFSHKFKAPVVALSSTHANGLTSYMTGNPAPAATVPDYLLPFNDHMTFLQRAINLVAGTVLDILHTQINLRLQESLLREFFGDDLPPLKEIIKNTSLVLVNQHHALAFSRPYSPNVIEIGGYHIQEPKALPEDLRAFFNRSKNGVILFSLGSILKVSNMSEKKIQALIGAFSKLKQDVLWKVDVDLEGLPKNVRTSKWLPQSDILAHPNLKLFITHGGLLSTTEAVHRGVPLVGIPVLGDQAANMKHVESLGFGKTLYYEDITEETVLSAVTEVLDNPSYREIVQERSRILKDNIMPPMEKAMFWIEYVIRHKGAPHMRSAAQDLAWYQLYLLDVLAVLALAAAAGFTVQYYFVRITLCTALKLYRGKSKAVREKNE